MTLRTALPLGLTSLLALAAPAMALTPEEAWQGWQTHAQIGGIRVTHGAEVQADGVLRVSDVAVDRLQPDGTGLRVSIGEIELAQRADGAVVMTGPASQSMQFRTFFGPATETPHDARLTWTSPDEITVLSGSPDVLTIDYSAPTLTITLEEMIPADGAPPADLVAEARIEGLTVHSVLTRLPDGSHSLNNHTELADLSLQAASKTPDGTLDVTLAASRAEIAARTHVPRGFTYGNTAQALRDGYALELRGTHHDLSLSVVLRQNDGEKRVSWRLGSIEFDQLFSRERLGFSSTLHGFGLDADPPSPGMPSISAALEELRIGLSGPAEMTESPQDFSARLHIAGLVLSEGVWGLIDRQAHFERGPASLRLDLSGKGRWLQDMLAVIANPDPLASSGRLPLELESLTLSRAELSLPGLNASAEGDLVFDNSDLTTWEGFPRPAGKVSVSIEGLNAMVERLAKAGLIPPAQLMPLRMGLAMFTRAAPGEDRRISMIEFRGRNLLINGQRIR